MNIPSSSSPRFPGPEEAAHSYGGRRRASAYRPGTSESLAFENPNSVSRWTASFQRSNYFIADALEPHSPGATIFERSRFDRIDSEWQGEQEAEQETDNEGDTSALRDDDESFLYRDYGATSNIEAENAARAFSEHHARRRGYSMMSESQPLVGSGASLRRHVSRQSMIDAATIEMLSGSTIYQTIFNSVNILMGIGILSLPLGIAYAGWIFGISLLTASGVVTLYTAMLLAKCMDASPMLFTYADVAYYAFGNKARYYTTIVFSMELMAASTALVVLFGDSFHALIPSITATQFKILGFFIFFITSFIPLSILSISSIIGILATTAVVVVVIADGFIKRTAPGSLIRPMTTNLWPAHRAQLPFAIGLMMSPWSAHSVFCNVYRDMRHPYRFKAAMTTSYSITYFLDITMGICGYLMFGNLVRDEVTQSILDTEGYPQFISYFIVVMISIVPLTKMPLNTRPIATTLDVLTGVDNRSITIEGSIGFSALSRSIIRICIRAFVNLVPVILGIYVPSFDRVMALLGSGLCYTICILLPISFYLTICKKDITGRERIGLYALFAISSVLGLVGTIWAFLPEEVIKNLG